MAPEFYKGVITFKTDIYSLGVTITQILIGKKYYSAADNVRIIYATVHLSSFVENFVNLFDVLT